MTAPVFLATASTLEPVGALADAGPGAALTLTGPEARHAVTVRRVRAWERIDLSDGRGLRLRCEVTSAGAAGTKDRLGVRVLERLEEPEPALRLALVQALAKGGRDEQAVETATQVGVEVVVPWQAQRCVSVWKGSKAARGRQRWQATAQEAAKQARRVRVPRIEEAVGTSRLAAWVRATVEAGGAVLVLHEEAEAPIGGVSLPGGGTVAVVVGPEGGIGGQEVAELEAAGAVTVRLGSKATIKRK